MNTRVETGYLTSPFGQEYRGFKVTIGGMLDPMSLDRTYEDIEKILKGQNVEYEIEETKTEEGTFKSYSISTD